MAEYGSSKHEGTARSIAHDLVFKVDVTRIKNLKFTCTLNNEKEAAKIDFIESYDMEGIKSALTSVEVIY
jgi:ABC-type transport system involved in cytochrome c biogenesis ATPase subunit